MYKILYLGFIIHCLYIQSVCSSYLVRTLPAPSFPLPKNLDAHDTLTGSVRLITSDQIKKTRTHVNNKLSDTYDTFFKSTNFTDPQDIIEHLKDTKKSILHSFNFNKNKQLTFIDYENIANEYNKKVPSEHTVQIDKEIPNDVNDLYQVLNYYTKKKYGFAPTIEYITSNSTNSSTCPAFATSAKNVQLSLLGTGRLICGDPGELLEKSENNTYGIHINDELSYYHRIPMTAHEYGHTVEAHALKRCLLATSIYKNIPKLEKPSDLLIIPKYLQFKEDQFLLKKMQRVHELEADTFYLNLPKELALSISNMHIKQIHDFITYEQLSENFLEFKKDISLKSLASSTHPTWLKRILYALKAHELLLKSSS